MLQPLFTLIKEIIIVPYQILRSFLNASTGSPDRTHRIIPDPQRLQKKYGTLINYKKYGGYELFFEHDESFFNCFDQIENINKLLKPIFKTEVFNQVNDFFGFKQTRSQLIFNRHEGQIDTGLMMRAYLKEAIANDIFILNNCELNDYYETEKSVEIMLNQQKFEVVNLLEQQFNKNLKLKIYFWQPMVLSLLFFLMNYHQHGHKF